MYNLYSLEVLRTAQQEVTSFGVTVKRKSDHYPKVEELRNLLTTIYTKTGNSLLNPDYCWWFQLYSEAVNTWYEKRTKADLDHILKQAIRRTLQELHLCEDAEYQTRDGRLVPHPTKAGQWVTPEVASSTE